MGRNYLGRLKKYIFPKKKIGIHGTRLDKILVDVIVKGLMEFTFFMIRNLVLRPILWKKNRVKYSKIWDPEKGEVRIDKYTWHRKGLDEDRKMILTALEKSPGKYYNLVDSLVNIGFIIIDHDFPYHVNYKTVIATIQHYFDPVDPKKVLESDVTHQKKSKAEIRGDMKFFSGDPVDQEPNGIHAGPNQQENQDKDRGYKDFHDLAQESRRKEEENLNSVSYKLSLKN